MVTLAVDVGAGNLKIVGPEGGVIVPSHVGIPAGERSGRAAGLRRSHPPKLVELDGFQAYVGDSAHDFGRPVENLDNSRFVAGAPDIRALLCGGLSLYAQEHGLHQWVGRSADVIVGLPQSALSESEQAGTVRGLKRWMAGSHEWLLNGVHDFIKVTDVTVTTQAAGALFDYLLDDDGEFVPQRKANYPKEIGIISVGMNTLEMLVVRKASPVERFTDSVTAGVRRLLELADPTGIYSRGELDAMLRSGDLDTSQVLPVCGSEVVGHIERRWGTAYKRFAAVVVVGGGALLLKDELLGRFNGRCVVPFEPVMAVARGLHKLALMRSRR